MRGVFGGAEAIPVVETTTRSLRNVPKGKELVHQTAEKEARIRKINRFPDSQTAVLYQVDIYVRVMLIYALIDKLCAYYVALVPLCPHYTSQLCTIMCIM